jgi:hypothetical protein
MPTFSLCIKGLGLQCALAHNFVHKKCGETGLGCRKNTQVARPMQTATIFSEEISSRKIKDLPQGKRISHKFIHRNCGQVTLNMHVDVSTWKLDVAAAKFLRMEKFRLKIKDLSVRKGYCAHFYPQKVCRTLLAAKLATRYIAQFVSV